MKIRFYESDEDMWADLGRAMDAADARVTEDQKNIRPGDIVVSDSGYGFPIFHEILDIERVVKDGLDKGWDEEDGIYTLDLYKEPHMKYYCFSRSYSEACPEGELGDVHRSVILAKVPRDVFEEIKSNGFQL